MADLPDLPKTEAAIVERTNAFRKAEGLPPLARNLALEHAAKQFAKYLAKSGRFAHEADGRSPADRAKEAGYWYCTVAENLALNLDSRGFTVDKLADETIDGWKKSPGHRRNMVLPHVTEIGVGIAQAMGPDPKYLTVQLFGRPQHLGYEFRVRNASAQAVSYNFGGKAHKIEPRVTATHKACDPGPIQFTGAGSWVGGSRIDASFEAADKALYEVTGRADGKVQVEVQK